MIDVENLALPEVPGVYIFKGEDGKILYVGKSNNIKARVASYFQSNKNLGSHIKCMVDKICDVEYIRCSSELEATFKEASLIRDLQPQYNIALKDSKSFPLVAIVYADDFPYITIKRETDLNCGSSKAKMEYFGPLKSKKIIKGSIQLLQSIFKFRTCDINIFENDKNRRYFRPCLLYYIKMCSAPCALKINKEAYMEDIKEFKEFLNGKGKELINNLSKRMRFYAKNLQFERAAEIRDKINALNSINERLDIFYYNTNVFALTKLNPIKSLEAIKEMFSLDAIPKIIDGIDISNISGKYATGSIVRFVNGYPDKSGYRRYKIKTIDCINDISMMGEVVTRRFTRLVRENSALPDILLLDGGLAHLNMIEKIISGFNLNVFIVALAKYEGNHIYTIKNKRKQKINPQNIGMQLLTFIRDEAHRFAQFYHKVLRRKSIVSK